MMVIPAQAGIQSLSERGHLMKQPTVYMLASQRNGTLYVGVTSHLIQRIHQHRNKEVDGFTTHYNVDMLVWYEHHNSMIEAIAREKAIKKWHRLVETASH